jgi:hypothetical protein
MQNNWDKTKMALNKQQEKQRNTIASITKEKKKEQNSFFDSQQDVTLGRSVRHVYTQPNALANCATEV